MVCFVRPRRRCGDRRDCLVARDADAIVIVPPTRESIVIWLGSQNPAPGSVTVRQTCSTGCPRCRSKRMQTRPSTSVSMTPWAAC